MGIVFEPTMDRGLNSQTFASWRQKKIKETLMDYQDGKISFGTEGDDWASTLEIGDNFVINAEFGNVEGVDLNVICCSKTLHIVNENFKFKWGT